MALQDLTPQLRTRLSRMERAVGWFVMLSLILLVSGFVYYLYNTAERKGWFRTKALFYTFTKSANGLKAGDSVTLIGLGVGQITRMEPMPPENQYNMYVEFELNAPYFGYIWSEGSYAVVAPASLLGSRMLEVTKGTNGYPTYAFHPLRLVSIAEARSLPDANNWVMAEELLSPDGTNLLARPYQPLTNLEAIASARYTAIEIMATNIQQKLMTGIWNDQDGRYEVYKKGNRYWLHSKETPAATDQLQALVAQVQSALPGVFNLTNELNQVLTNTAALTSNLNVVAVSARPAVSNLSAALATLDQPGALGRWLLPTNVVRGVEDTLGAATTSLTNASTNLTMLASNLNRSLDSLAGITGNLHEQVAANPTLLRGVADAIVHADQLVQGLKRFWLFRHLFPADSGTPAPPANTNSPPASPGSAVRSPKDPRAGG
jgi:ABC-type transporter Mla subunit MlaD